MSGYETFAPDGTVRARWDHQARTVTDFTLDPPSVRPYTAEENAAADAAQVAQTARANEATLREQVQTRLASIAVTVEAMRVIGAKANNTIGPKDTKDVADAVRDIGQDLRKVIRLVVGALDSMS